MTRTLARVLTWLSLVAVIVVAGVHAVYYLLYWEWGRAQIAVAWFVAALVVGATFLLLSRIRALSRQVDALTAYVVAATATTPGAAGPEAAPSATGPSATTDPEPRPDLPWLETPTHLRALTALPAALGLVALDPPRGGVFIPVFLATGLAVSVIASAVERLAALRHRAPAPVAAGVAGAAVATAGGGGGAGVVTAPAPARQASPLALVAAPVVGVLMIAGAVGALWFGAHYWGQPLGPGTTTMTVEVHAKGPTTTDTDVVETLGRYCALNSGVIVRYGSVAAGPGDTTLLRLHPQLDADGMRRFTGCLEDAVLEWHRLEVLGTTVAPRAG